MLALAVVAMICVANLQYGWTRFVKPMEAAHPDWTDAAIKSAFGAFVLAQTWIVPLNGWIADRYGPKPMVALAGILVAIGWLVDAHATTIGQLSVGEILSGIGTGFVYGTMVGVAVKWFPDRRGLAVGLVAAGFGAGTALTVIPIGNMIKASGYAHTFQTFGLIQGVIVFIIAFFLAFPRAEEVPVVAAGNASAARMRKISSTPLQMLATPTFWLLYVMMVMIATGLLYITQVVEPMAKDYGIAASMITLILIVDNLSNGGSRILFGALSDRLGREVTMAIAFTAEALGLLGLIFASGNAALFLVCAAMSFLASGEIYSLFPAACTDIFGAKYATTNSGLLYTAKGTAAWVVVYFALAFKHSGYSTTLAVLVAFTIVVAGLAVAALKPMRERAVAKELEQASRSGAGVAPAT